MESKEDTVGVKEEPNATWLDTGENSILDSVDSCEVKNFKTFTFHRSPVNHIHETSAFQKRLNEKLIIDFECKDVKPECKPFSTFICKSDHQYFLPIVKTENQIQNCYFDGKSLMIMIKKDFDYYNNCLFKVNPRLKIDEHKKVKILRKKTPSKLSCECKLCQKTNKDKASLNIRINSTHNRRKPFECDICHKSFREKGKLKRHIKTVHERSKPFECEICYKSFGEKNNLSKHISTVNNRIKPIECEICYKSFGEKGKLKRHIMTVHDHRKPFECDNCHKSFGEKNNLSKHISTVHNRIKPFECKICHKPFGYENVLKKHIITVHNHSKPFECEICHKKFARQDHLKSHIMTVHDRRKPFECDISQKLFVKKVPSIKTSMHIQTL